jgi:hypothetical protein
MSTMLTPSSRPSNSSSMHRRTMSIQPSLWTQVISEKGNKPATRNDACVHERCRSAYFWDACANAEAINCPTGVFPTSFIGLWPWCGPSAVSQILRGRDTRLSYCFYLAPRAGFEPATNRLTAGCSTAELPGNSSCRARNAYNKAGPALKAAKRRKSRCVCLGFAQAWLATRSSRWLARAAFARWATAGNLCFAAPAKEWRPRPELNRGTRFCRPLRNHSATWPKGRRRGCNRSP